MLISPLGFPINSSTRYAGIERLVWEYSGRLNGMGFRVSVLGHPESIFPPGVLLLSDKVTRDFINDEITAVQKYLSFIRSYDVIHDFSHTHAVSIYLPNSPTLNIFWHSPCYAQFPKAKYNIVALSQWAADEFEKYYHQKARFQQSIVIDTELYKPAGKRGDRFLTIGRQAPEKGNLNAIKLCKELNLPLDVCGGRGAGVSDEPLTDYEKEIIEACDGKQIAFQGEVSESQKIYLMQRCAGLIYCTDHMEVTNHKLQEAMLCGAPVIAPNHGGQIEIVTHEVNGYLCNEWEDYKKAILNVDKLTPEKTREELVAKYSIGNVVKNYLPLYQEVDNGLRW